MGPEIVSFLERHDLARQMIVLAAMGLLAVTVAYDLWTNPKNPKRAREYVFLGYTMLVACAYGVAHDQLTATISPEYFLLGKGLAGDPRPFRWAVAVLAVQASFAAGLFAGMALLLANNPRRSGTPPQLPYRALVKLTLVPLGVAVVVAAAFGAINANAEIGKATAATLAVTPPAAHSFVIVWAIHAGSYAGALLGTLASVVAIVVRRWTRSAAAHTG